MTAVGEVMTDRATIERSAGAPCTRFTLRTLFIISVAIAVPFLLLANLRSVARPDDSLASPLYLLLGVAGVLFAAVIGNALGRTPGMLITGIAAGLIWISLVALLSQFSDMLTRQLPVHIVAVVLTIAGLTAAVRRHRESTDDTPHEHLVRLLKVKSSLNNASTAKDRTGIKPAEASDEMKST